MSRTGWPLSGRSVFVTGHTGFKGSWLALWLHHLGARVAGYSLAPPTVPSHFEAAEIRPLLSHHFEADIRDRAGLREAIERSAPSVLFHLAAQPLVRESYASPFETFEVNVLGTAAVLEAVRQSGRPCVVIVITSDKCYEDRGEPRGHRETDPVGGSDPYSASKGAAEIVAAAYRRSFFAPDQLSSHGVKTATARAGNVIGGGDWAADRIVPDMVRALSRGEPVGVRNPASRRPWQHVLEPLGGYLTLASKMVEEDSPELCSAWNFGPAPGDELPVSEIVERFLDAWGGGDWADRSEHSAPHEREVLRLEIDKAAERLGWRPRWGVEEAVWRTARWYKTFAQSSGGRTMREASLAEIEDYEAAGGGS